MTEFAQSSTPAAVAPAEDLDLRRYVAVLWHRRRMAAATALVALAVALTVHAVRPPQYEAEAFVQLSDQGDRLFASIGSAAQFVRSTAFLAAVAAAAGPDVDSAVVLRGLRVESIRDGQAIRLRFRHTRANVSYEVVQSLTREFIGRASQPVEHRRLRLQQRLRRAEAQLGEIRRLRDIGQTALAETARARAHGTSEGLVSHVLAVQVVVDLGTAYREAENRREDLLQQLDELRFPVILQPARVPDAPVAPQTAQNVMLALLLGAMTGVGAASFQEFWAKGSRRS